MTVRELGHRCKKYDCDDCPYKKQCDRMTVLLAGISPEALLKLLETELDWVTINRSICS